MIILAISIGWQGGSSTKGSHGFHCIISLAKLSSLSAWRITSFIWPPWNWSSYFLTSGSALTISSFSYVIFLVYFLYAAFLGICSRTSRIFVYSIHSLSCGFSYTQSHKTSGLQQACRGSPLLLVFNGDSVLLSSVQDYWVTWGIPFSEVV